MRLCFGDICRARQPDRRRFGKLALAAAGLVSVAACAPVVRTGPTAVGVHLARASYDPGGPQPEPDEVRLDDAAGIRVSYGRRLMGDRKLWLGPEASVGWVPQSDVSGPRTDYPAGISRSFAAGLLRLNFYPGVEYQGTGGWLDELLYRTGFVFGVGVGYGRFSESSRLIDGAKNDNRRVDGAFGPVLGFGLDFQINEHAVVRTDGYVLFLEPELSFPWPNRFADKLVGGGGLVILF